MNKFNLSFLFILFYKSKVKQLLALIFLCPLLVSAIVFIPNNDQKHLNESQQATNLQQSQQLLKSIPAGQDYAQIDDMRFNLSDLKWSGFTGTKWPNGKVYYVFDQTVSSKNRTIWRKAAEKWSKIAAISFVEGVGNGNYIYVKNDSSNWSYVGMIGGAQQMGVFSWNYPIIVAHEICHALGGIHEQSRSDRDDYVHINWSYIKSGKEHNFEIRYGVIYGDYDYNSCMHYGAYAFSLYPYDGHVTIYTWEQRYQWVIGQRKKLSRLDKLGMIQQYGSLEPTGSIKLKSLNFREIYGEKSKNNLSIKLSVPSDLEDLSALEDASLGSILSINGKTLKTFELGDISVINKPKTKIKYILENEDGFRQTTILKLSKGKLTFMLKAKNISGCSQLFGVSKLSSSEWTGERFSIFMNAIPLSLVGDWNGYLKSKTINEKCSIVKIKLPPKI